MPAAVKMFPSQAILDHGGRSPANAEYMTQLSGTFTGLANRYCLRFCQLGPSVARSSGLQSQRNSVACILFFGDVFEIIKTVIVLVSVLVVDFFSCRAWTNESSCYQSVNHETLTASAFVGRFIEDGKRGTSVVMSPIADCYFLVKSKSWADISNSPIVRYFVEFFEISNRHRKPLEHIAPFYFGKRVAIFQPQ